MNRQVIAAFAAALAGASAALCGTPALATDAVRDKQWHLKSLDIANAQRISTGRGVTVAVIDSGVSSHPDLAGSVLNGIDYVKRGGNGRTDNAGHGTKMASLIAAHGKGGRGALGIAPDAQILPIRVFDDRPRDNVEVGEAIEYAVSQGAKVINLSLSSGVDPRTLDAVQAAARADVVMVASAGNKPDYFAITPPAVFEEVVAVGATDKSGKKSAVSVSGAALDLMAPGEGIEGASRGQDYETGTGTSDSAAIVSGAAALLRSKYPNMSAAEVVERLESTAVDKGAPGVDPDYGHGIIDIVAALSDPASSPAASAAPAPTATTAAPAPAPAPQAETEPASSNTPLIVGGVAVLVALGGLVAFLLARRRSHPTSG
ncbi:type VII secretion-associated serine protease mycosin [Actinoplanes auranticolor]|uniref:Type VII secretion-associated serine protease n=1 Tax=Actinoplanes auranticolor TaxID=47988 RepID=A0A919W4E2_9ACTN|nr:type VII secretion-associated serine protease mycosin [Actinoplanes auranticolor]GIM79258.1 type VII secretion-associated serine protease [Actinoplanes auranticolor]